MRNATALNLTLICTSTLLLSCGRISYAFTHSCYSSFGSDALVIEPRTTVYREVAEEAFSVFCRLRGNASTSRVVFTKGILPSQQNSREFQVVNETTIELKLNSSEADKFKVTCFDPFTNDSCVREVVVGYPPVNVKKFGCVSFSWRILECSYEVPSNPAQDSVHHYHLSYSNYGRRVYGYKCSGSHWDSCCRLEGDECWRWGDSTDFPFDKGKRIFTFTVSSSNPLGNRSYHYSFDQYSMMVPDPAERLSATPLTPDLIGVSWKLPPFLHLFPPGIIHRIQVEGCGGRRTLLGKPGRQQKLFRSNVTVEWPGQNYTIAVSLRSGGAKPWSNGDPEDRWWSSPMVAEVTTPPVPPLLAPETVRGGFYIWNQEGGMMTVAVYWKEVDPCFRGGRGLHYDVGVFAHGRRVDVHPLKVRRRRRSRSSLSSSSAVFEHLLSSVNYTFRVTPYNVAGKGEKFGEIRIYRNDDEVPNLHFPVLVLDPTEETIFLRWFPHQGKGQETEPKRRNYTVLWCENDGGPSSDTDRPCEGELSWKEVGRVTSTTLTKGDFSMWGDVRKTRFAVSYEDFSEEDRFLSVSGMMWSSCSVGERDPRGTETKPALQLKQSRGSMASVRWTLSCKSWREEPKGVEVFWCQGTFNTTSQCDAQTATHTDVSSSHYIIRGLEGGRNYTAWIRIHFGQTKSDFSEPLNFTTSHKELSVVILISIGGAAVVMTLAIATAVFCSQKVLLSFLRKAREELSIPAGIAKLQDPTPKEGKPHPREKKEQFGPWRNAAEDPLLKKEATKDFIMEEVPKNKDPSARTNFPAIRPNSTEPLPPLGYLKALDPEASTLFSCHSEKPEAESNHQAFASTEHAIVPCCESPNDQTRKDNDLNALDILDIPKNQAMSLNGYVSKTCLESSSNFPLETQERLGLAPINKESNPFLETQERSNVSEEHLDLNAVTEEFRPPDLPSEYVTQPQFGSRLHPRDSLVENGYLKFSFLESLSKPLLEKSKRENINPKTHDWNPTDTPTGYLRARHLDSSSSDSIKPDALPKAGNGLQKHNVPQELGLAWNPKSNTKVPSCGSFHLQDDDSNYPPIQKPLIAQNPVSDGYVAALCFNPSFEPLSRNTRPRNEAGSHTKDSTKAPSCSSFHLQDDDSNHSPIQKPLLAQNPVSNGYIAASCLKWSRYPFSRSARLENGSGSKPDLYSGKQGSRSSFPASDSAKCTDSIPAEFPQQRDELQTETELRKHRLESELTPCFYDSVLGLPINNQCIDGECLPQKPLDSILGSLGTQKSNGYVSATQLQLMELRPENIKEINVNDMNNRRRSSGAVQGW